MKPQPLQLLVLLLQYRPGFFERLSCLPNVLQFLQGAKKGGLEKWLDQDLIHTQVNSAGKLLLFPVGGDQHACCLRVHAVHGFDQIQAISLLQVAAQTQVYKNDIPGPILQGHHGFRGGAHGLAMCVAIEPGLDQMPHDGVIVHHQNTHRR